MVWVGAGKERECVAGCDVFGPVECCRFRRVLLCCGVHGEMEDEKKDP